MAPESIHIEIDLDSIATRLCQRPDFIDALINNPEFINAVRLAMTKDSRGLGDLYGKVAQRRQRPETSQPNTRQRVF